MTWWWPWGDNEQLTRIERKVDIMAGELAALAVEVAEDTNVMHSAIILLGNLHDLLVAAGTDPAKLADLTSQLATSKEALAAAVVANTPAA